LPPPWSSYCFHAPIATMLKLLLLGHSWSSQTLKLLWISCSWGFELLKLSLGRKLWRWKWVQKEVGGEGVSRMREVGGLVGRRAVGRLG
jgi:hypothetical protein